MELASVDASQILRISEIDRTDFIASKYRCCRKANGSGIELLEEKLRPAEEFANCDEEGVRRRAEWWKQEIEGGGALFLAEEDGKVCGFAVLGPEKPGKTAEIVALFIDRAHRGKGLTGRRPVPLPISLPPP